MLPSATVEQIVASGFHRNTPHQTEGGSDPEQYRVDRVKNRTDTTGAVWLGLTVGCAQCHDHKFDPISQAEYYGLYAFFNSDDEPKQKVGGASTLVLRARSKPRATFVHLRGDFLEKGPPVEPTTPAIVAPATPGTTRLDLARWLVDKRNPLTARVVVNRMWQHFFGVGIVETDEDFGSQGALPSHPRLLDRLALEIQRRAWSGKHLQRMLLTSATYRQASRMRPDLRRVDPKNILLGRQARFRVEAEVIRDVALAASGLLDSRLGGASVFPPIPDGVAGTSSARHKWPTSRGADRYRRGLYTAIYRAEEYPMIRTFDGPGRDFACTRRTRSNTPLQALTLANDPAFVEIARAIRSAYSSGNHRGRVRELCADRRHRR